MLEKPVAAAGITLTVRLFASFREAAGTGRVEQEVAEGARVRDVSEALCGRFPQLCGGLSKGLIAVNQQYVGEDMQLRDGDEVAFIPPVSGGA